MSFSQFLFFSEVCYISKYNNLQVVVPSKTRETQKCLLFILVNYYLFLLLFIITNGSQTISYRVYQFLYQVNMARLLCNIRHHFNMWRILEIVLGKSFESECLELTRKLLCYSGVTLTPLNSKAWLTLLNHCSKGIKAFNIKNINILYFASQLKYFYLPLCIIKCCW
jgi:hypothetical protein